MNPLKSFIVSKFGLDYDKLSPVKKHAFNAFEAFNGLAQSEIQSPMIQKVFDYVKTWIARKMLEKPDKELKQKMLLVYKEMQPLFEDVGVSIEAQASEALGSIKIPRVGELGKKLELVSIDEKKATLLLKELLR